jgi:hypothetical protein
LAIFKLTVGIGLLVNLLYDGYLIPDISEIVPAGEDPI